MNIAQKDKFYYQYYHLLMCMTIIRLVFILVPIKMTVYAISKGLYQSYVSGSFNLEHFSESFTYCDHFGIKRIFDNRSSHEKKLYQKRMRLASIRNFMRHNK